MHNIRPLRESDKDDILEIARHTWDGHDYLPYAFDAWMKDQDSHTAAIEHEGHIIALANLRVRENGRTGWRDFVYILIIKGRVLHQSSQSMLYRWQKRFLLNVFDIQRPLLMRYHYI